MSRPHRVHTHTHAPTLPINTHWGIYPLRKLLKSEPLVKGIFFPVDETLYYIGLSTTLFTLNVIIIKLQFFFRCVYYIDVYIIIIMLSQ